MQPDEIAALCKKNRMPAVGITDTNNLFGLWDLTDAIVKAGVQMIVGCQFNLPLEPEKRTGPVPVAQQLGTIAVLVQSEKGYANLMKLASKAHLEVQVGEAPHISWEALAQYSGDLSYDGSPSAKWSAVGHYRPETIEFAFFSIRDSTGYFAPTLHYGRLP